MRHLSSYELYNEESGFMNKAKKFFKKTVKFLKGNASLDDALEEYDIETVKINNYEYKFYHNKNLVARIFQPDDEEGSEMNRPVFKIYIYLYDFEVANKNNWKMANLDPDSDISNELKRQTSRPYYKLAKKSFTMEWLVQSFYEFWASKTKSGRNKTAELNKPKQSAKPLRHFEPSVRKKGFAPHKQWWLPFGQDVSRNIFK